MVLSNYISIIYHIIQIENANKRNKIIIRKVDNFKKIMMLIASKEVVGLWQLLKTALKHGASAAEIVEVLEKSIAGLYSPWGGFSDCDIDIAFLVKAIGGPQLLYTLQKSHGLALCSTVQRHVNIPHLLSLISQPSANEISKNISAFLSPNVKPPPPTAQTSLIPGNILMFDDIALEMWCWYCSRQNHIVGLCWEHVHRVNTEVNSLETIENVCTALFDANTDTEKVCFGVNATVVAIAPYAWDDYYLPVPIVVSPSDKTEKGNNLAQWVKVVLETYRNHKHSHEHGPVWALGSNGDSAFWHAKYILCMTTPLDPLGDLGAKLLSLQGLNLYTSPECMVGTCDPKHIFKRQSHLYSFVAGQWI